MNYKTKDFLPLILIFLLIIILTIIKASIQMQPLNWYWIMNDFMGFFFVIFAIFKIINLKKFAEAYSEYDLIAKHSTIYAYFYPFIELTLGISYLLHWFPDYINWITLIIMLINSAGVAYELSKGKTIICACLGAVFKIPMTYVTLLEDLLMAIMALIMLIK